jgi:glycosyltransferase involved in cell wall biosynthesis
MMNRLLRYKNHIKKILPEQMRNDLRFWLLRQNISRVRPIRVTKARRRNFPDGINLFCDVAGASGIAEASRGLALGIRTAGIPLAVCDCFGEDASCYSPYNINIIHTNPGKLIEVFNKVEDKQWAGGYNIGFWAWEIPEFPKNWSCALPLFDEIWGPSEFSAKALRMGCEIPITVIPHIIDARCDELCDRSFFGLPEDIFFFLVLYDSGSEVVRKNPFGSISAYKMAFNSEQRDVGLVIKTRNASEKDLKRLREELSGYNNIFILNQDYKKSEINSLIRACNVYVSLHLAEGFGLVMAEAMYLGTPVIATNWSANTEYMTNNTACLVDAQVVQLAHNIGPYKKGNHWAEPNSSQAAGYMRKLFFDRAFSHEMTRKAQEHIIRVLDKAPIALRISSRVEQIYEKWNS